MLRRTLNLGIVAHVDAGKTTLTERLLFSAGVIDAVGSVDKGTTQTDFLPLEQQRGITIRSAVVSFELGDITVNLIDTPGHPDFIAEVERVLSVLDGAVLVVSGVEGVQPQTRVLMRALRRLRIPTLIFVNKLDRVGADFGRVLGNIAERLTTAVVAVDRGDDGELLDVLAENDSRLLAAFVEDERSVSSGTLRAALRTQARDGLVHPVFGGSAITGAGVEELMVGLAELLPAEHGDAAGPLSGTVFKIERGPGGEKVAYARLFSGSVGVRDVVHFGSDGEAKVTGLSVFAGGESVRRRSAAGREIARLWGLRDVQVGDTIGEPPPRVPQREFPPPTLESVVVPQKGDEAQALRVALEQLAEQDPLINVRDTGQQLTVSLYGEVQKEVIEATLASDFGLEVAFRETTPIYVERPVAAGEAVEILHADSNPFHATIGLRIEPGPVESGIAFRLPVHAKDAPLFVYGTLESFREHMDDYVRETLREGLLGWQVTDCVVTMIRCMYSVADGPPSRRGPTSTAADFRKLTPLVLRQALELAGTVVCEPTVRVSLEVPTASVGAVMPALIRLGGTVETPSARAELSTLEGVLPVGRADELQRQLAGLTGGEGVLESSFAGYQPVNGDQPIRAQG